MAVELLHATDFLSAIRRDGHVRGFPDTVEARKRGVFDMPLVYTMVVDAADRAPCCPGHGDATLRVAPWMLDAACPAGWLLCRPARQATVEGRHDLFCTLYLVPANAPELPPSAQRGLWPPSDELARLGLMYLSRAHSGAAALASLQEQLDSLVAHNCTRRRPRRSTHLHAALAVRELPIELRCVCGQQASPACDSKLCAACCGGCSRHGYAEAESSSSVEQALWCGCGQQASLACDDGRCGRCCRGCSRHGYAQAEPSSGAGQARWCGCGQQASPACDFGACGSCCRGCSRHAAVNSTCSSSYVEESEASYHHTQEGAGGFPIWCACGKQASPACDNQECGRCCGGCRRHAFAAREGDGGGADGWAFAMFSEPRRCDCGSIAAPGCQNGECGACCGGCHIHA